MWQPQSSRERSCSQPCPQGNAALLLLLLLPLLLLLLPLATAADAAVAAAAAAAAAAASASAANATRLLLPVLLPLLLLLLLLPLPSPCLAFRLANWLKSISVAEHRLVDSLRCGFEHMVMILIMRTMLNSLVLPLCFTVWRVES